MFSFTILVGAVDDNAGDSDDAEDAEDGESAGHAICAAESRNRPFSIIVREDIDDIDAGDDSGLVDASTKADDSGETKESGGEASGAEDVGDAADAK